MNKTIVFRIGNTEVKELADKPSFIETYDSILWNSMLDEVIVNEDGTIQFKFKVGKEITL